MRRKSIVESDWGEFPFDQPQCFLCGRETGLEIHHIMPGPNRRLSDRYGLWCHLCHDCHTGTRGAQYDREIGDRLKREAQMAFEELYSHDEWMRIFKKNYL
jgi:hypothetical protein